MSVSAGILGLPNVGKSTTFNALTNAKAESANYPFCTIDPNKGVVPVPDARLKLIQKYIPTDRVIPAAVDIWDIAGLVRGASQGEGRGNKFLADIREVDALLHVVRCFDNDQVTHVDGSIDPIRDVETIDLELALADLQSLEKRIEKTRRAAKSGDKTELAKLAVQEKMVAALNDGIPARAVPLDPQEKEAIHDSHLLTIKPVLFVANVADDDLEGKSPHVTRLREYAATTNARMVIICSTIEAELAELEEEERLEMLAGLGIEEPALSVLIRATYDLLGLQSYFTAGVQEIRAWTIHKGFTAPQAAGVIHSDFEKKFIRAEVFTVADLVEYKNEAGIKAAGKFRLEGKEYIVQDGDIMHFRHGA
jgi:GTP-binding protein YchF